MSKSIHDYDYNMGKFLCWDRYEEGENLSENEMYTVYALRTKIDNQTVEIEFQCDEKNNSKSNIRHWNIALTIGTKRKHFDKYHDNKEVCGKIGLQGLLFAKAAIQYFEEFLTHTEFSQYKNILYATWLDHRRRDAYAYGLKKLGFDFGVYNKKKVLLKEVII